MMRFCSSSIPRASVFLIFFCVILVPVFLHAQTEDRALAVANRATEALGGREAWDSTRYLVFTFAVQDAGAIIAERTHFWDKWDQLHRVEGVTSEGERFVVLEDLESRTGQAWLDGEQLRGEALEGWLERAYAIWINDTYWLLMPYKLTDPGVNLSWEGEETIGEKTYDRLHLSFDQVGLTPGDQYWAWIDRETGLMDRWAFVLEGQEPPARVYDWKPWRPYGDIMMAAERVPVDGGRSIVFPDLAVPEELPDSVFTSPDAPKVTTLVIRATSRDAKIIGSGVGGARITVRDAESGDVLVEGLQTGGTGDTDSIIRKPHPRDGVVYETEGAAFFLATLLLDEPTRVTVEAEGPLDYPQAIATTSKTMTVIPGESVRGEGILLEIHGFIVEILAAELRHGETTGEELYVRVRLRMT